MRKEGDGMIKKIIIYLLFYPLISSIFSKGKIKATLNVKLKTIDIPTIK